MTQKTVIYIEEKAEKSHSEPNKFEAVVEIDRHKYPITILNPFSPEDESRLSWYFEQYIENPFLKPACFDAAKQSIGAYGVELYKQVFEANGDLSKKLYHLLESRCELQFEISGSPSFHSLHWESMKHPDDARAFSLKFPFVRIAGVDCNSKAKSRDSSILNILLVTARPQGAGDIGYRTISRTLVEMLDETRLPVHMDIVRPGTYKALENTLSQKGSGYYHMVHFDVHGCVLSYSEYSKAITSYDKNPEGNEANKVLMRYGRDAFKNYEGKSAFILLNPEDGKDSESPSNTPDFVKADELAGLLRNYDVPFVIFNACQSAVGSEDIMSNMALQMVKGGICTSLGMSYSVSVSGAKVMMEHLYKGILKKLPLNEAITLARREMFNIKKRRAAYKQNIELEDWILPVVFQSSQEDISIRQMTPAEHKEWSSWIEGIIDKEEPQYSFWGRDTDILEIENRLLSKNNILLIQGMGGTGKTTLMKHLAWWWQKTDLIGNVCYFAYDKKAYTLEQLLNEICTALMPDYKSYGFHADSPKVQMDTIARYLKENRRLIILDNLESITGEAMAVKNTLPEEEREKIRKFLGMLKGGKTLVLLGSRSSEPWLSKGTFGKNIYILKGLDDEAATGLATAVLEDIGESGLKGQEDFNTLLAFLKGYPLAIELVLQNLSHQTPAQVLEGLRKGDVDLDGEGEERTTSILKCVEYSFYFLSEAEQKTLLALAPFATKIVPSAVINYIDKLRESPEWADYLSGEDFDNVLKKAVHWGLASWDSQYDFILHLQPVLSYYLQSRLTGMGSLKQAAEEVFYTHYCNCCKEIYGKMKSKSAEDRQIGFFYAAVEYENIYRAIQSALDIKKPVRVLYDVIHEFLEKQNEFNTALSISRGILEKLMRFNESLENKDFRNDILSIVDLCGNYSLRLQKYDEAETYYKKILGIIVKFEDEYSQASTYHQLGRVAQDKRELDDAEAYFKKALEIKIKFGYEYEQAGTYHQLGILAQYKRELDDAKAYFKKALEIKVKFGDEYEQASTYHQLGIVAQEKRELDDAEAYFKKALEISIKFGDEYSQAGIYHQLGTLAQYKRELDDAEAYFKKALEILIKFGAEYEQARVYHQLGSVAQEKRELDDAEAYFKKALEILIKFGDEYSQALTYHELGIVAQAKRELDDAEAYFKKALEIFTKFGDEYEQAGTYHQLGRVAQDKRELDDAEAYYKKALEIKIKFGDEYSQASTYHQLGRVAQDKRELVDAKAHFKKALEIKIKFGDEYSQASTYHQLGSVAQEKRELDDAEAYFKKALEIKIKFGDEYSQASTYHQLGSVAQDKQQEHEAVKHYCESLKIYIVHNDQHYVFYPLYALFRLHKANPALDIFKSIQEALDADEDEMASIKEMYNKWLIEQND